MLVEVAGALPLALLLSFVIAWVLRRLFGARLSLPLSVMTIVSLLGVSLGLFLAGWFFVGLRLWMPTALLLAAGSSLGLSFLVAGVAALLRRDGAIDVAALLEKGESDRVEFKETARWNVRDDKKDARMEQVVAKTVAAFLNSSGGTLLIGVDDDGRVHGLDRDFATLRTPDADRFELWLRDMLTASLERTPLPCRVSVSPRSTAPRSAPYAARERPSPSSSPRAAAPSCGCGSATRPARSASTKP